MHIDASVLRGLQHEQHDRFVRNANEIVIESFIFTGDRDYLTARFAFFQKQSHLFLWSAAQALEKYIKANILLLGSGVIKRIHKHTELAKMLRETHAERLKIDTAMPDGWAEQGVAPWPNVDVDGFLRRIEMQGSPDVRYDQVQLEVHLQDLVLLDRTAFRLRYELIFESVESCRLVGAQLKQCFFDLNYSFAPEGFKHPPLTGLRMFHTSVSKLEAAVRGCYGHAGAYQDWAQKSMGVKPEDLRKLMGPTKDQQ
ncbi:MAG: hypothetical protein RJA34_660 [Pseudomonadota bacterium]|jgi:hypothetical protein